MTYKYIFDNISTYFPYPFAIFTKWYCSQNEYFFLFFHFFKMLVRVYLDSIQSQVKCVWRLSTRKWNRNIRLRQFENLYSLKNLIANGDVQFSYILHKNLIYYCFVYQRQWYKNRNVYKQQKMLKVCLAMRGRSDANVEL